MSSESGSITSVLNLTLDKVLNVNVLILEGDKTATDATNLMKLKNARSVLVTHAGEAVGIVTKTDILFKVMSQGRNPDKVKLREIMTAPVITLPINSTIADALKIMDKHVIRQVIVGSGSAVLGMVTREELFEKIQRATISASETVFSGAPVCIINPKAIALIKDNVEAKLSCPYCESKFNDKEVLSKHIDRIHSGSGVLEGDVRKMFD